MNRRIAVYTIAATAIAVPGLALASFTATRSNPAIHVGAGSLTAPANGSVNTSGVTSTSVSINVTAGPTSGFAPSGYTVTRTSPTTGSVCTITGITGSCTDAHPVAGQTNAYAITSFLTGTSWTSPTPATTSAAVPSSVVVATPSKPAMLASDDSGEFNDDDITNITKPHFTGIGGTPGNTIQLFFDGSSTANGTGTVRSDGTWSVAPSTALSGAGTNGTAHTVVAKESVGGTTSSASASQAFTVDTTAPATPAGSSGKYTGSGVYVDNVSPNADVINTGPGTVSATGETGGLALEAVETAGPNVNKVFMSSYGTTASPTITVDNATASISYKFATVDVAGNASTFVGPFAESDSH